MTTVILRGHVVPLSSLKKTLRRLKVTQDALAADSGLHQSTVSAQLSRGITDSDLLDAVDHALRENGVDPAHLDGALPCESPSRLSRELEYLLNRDNESVLRRENPGVGVSLAPFPMEEAHKLALAVRKDFEKGGVVRQNFSMRKLKLWGEAFYLLQADGFSVDEALQGSFHAAAVGKTLPKTEEREFLLRHFDILFGAEPALPKKNGNSARADGNRHPMDYVAEPLIRAGIPVWITGESATGKTWSAKSLARRTADGFIRMQGTHDTHEDDFVGGMAAKDGSTFFQYGPLPLAMSAGKKLIIDELSFVPSGALASLQAVLEGEPLVIKANAGEVIAPQRGFGIIVTDNTRGLGEGLAYVGTEVVNESVRDRFLFLEWEYMSPSQEQLAVGSHLEELLTRNGWTT